MQEKPKYVFSYEYHTERISVGVPVFHESSEGIGRIDDSYWCSECHCAHYIVSFGENNDHSVAIEHPDMLFPIV